jgi:predicted dehydrogenase
VIRVAIIGCGKIADQHVQAIRRIAGSAIVAVCDREPLMANQLAERFGIAASFSDVGEMLKLTQPDAVHVTTPPQSHLELGRQCLEAGSHVYLEKPFTVTANEAETLIEVAGRLGLKVTAGHNYQFTAEMMEMRRVVEQGFLGGAPVHLESHWSYDLGDLSYVGPLLGNPDHWVRKLPGQLLHNNISHGVARLAEFLDDELVEVVTNLQQSAHLRSLGGKEVMDELRVLIRDRNGMTAFFCFSTQIKPGLNRFRLCGPVNSLSVDLATGSVFRNHGRSYKSYLTYLIPPLLGAKAHVANAGRNAFEIFRWRLHQDSGMKELIERFHRSIADGAPPPIPYREIVLTARIMDSVFARYRAVASYRDSPGDTGT